MLTSVQIRAARSALGWSAEHLSKLSGVSRRTIVSIEAAEGVPPANASTLDAIRKALEASGIEFIGSPEDRPGIRLAVPSQEK